MSCFLFLVPRPSSNTARTRHAWLAPWVRICHLEIGKLVYQAESEQIFAKRNSRPGYHTVSIFYFWRPYKESHTVTDVAGFAYDTQSALRGIAVLVPLTEIWSELIWGGQRSLAGGLHSIGSQRVGHNEAALHTSTHAHTHTHIWSGQWNF